MDSLNIAITNLTSIISTLNNLQQTGAACTTTNVSTLLSQANLAYNNVISYASETLDETGNLLSMNSGMADSLNDLTGIAKEMNYEQEKIINSLNTQKSTKMKEIQFNTYYAQMNSYNANIMKILVLSSVLMMINIYLYTRKYIPDNIYTIISIVIISITIIIISRMIYSEFRRSNYNFNTFNWTQPIV